MAGKKHCPAWNTTYTGELISFTVCDKPIGKGGNGQVFNIKPISNDCTEDMVVKFFKTNKDTSITKQRYARFQKEINVVKSLQDDIPGIMKILDINLPPNTPKHNDEAWYIMPKANPLQISNSYSILQNLQIMLNIGEALIRLHASGHAHRDIKPENILLMDDQVFLSDFGLVWHKGDERISNKDERIGPYRILPPELEEVDLELDSEYYPADVYLFAKVIWIMVSKHWSGFYGKYTREDTQIYLDKEKYKDKNNYLTFEPLRQLLETATHKYMDKRPKIEECVELLKEQIKICEGALDENKLANYIFKENHYLFYSRLKPVGLIIEDSNYNNIIEFLNNATSLNFDVYENNQSISGFDVDIIEQKGEHIWEAFKYYNGECIKQYLFKVQKYQFPADENQPIILFIANFDEYISYNDYIPLTESHSAFMIHSRKIALDRAGYIEIKRK